MCTDACGCVSSNGSGSGASSHLDVCGQVLVCVGCVCEERIRQEFDGDILRPPSLLEAEKNEKTDFPNKRLTTFWFPLVEKFDSPSTQI
jgi:hypothetical protein